MAYVNRQQKRNRRTSHTKLKKQGMLDWSDLSKIHVPSTDELKLMNKLWKGYMRSVMGSCKSATHYQARVMDCEMVGADIEVRDCKVNKSMIGTRGTVIADTENCFIVAAREQVLASSIADRVDRHSTDSACKRRKLNDDTAQANEEYTWIIKPYRIVKCDSVISLTLPKKRQSKVQDEVPTDTSKTIECLIHGRSFLPDTYGGSGKTQKTARKSR